MIAIAQSTAVAIISDPSKSKTPLINPGLPWEDSRAAITYINAKMNGPAAMIGITPIAITIVLMIEISLGFSLTKKS